MPQIHTRQSLSEKLSGLGIGAGHIVMVHAAMSRVGRMLHGPDALIGALLDTVGSQGTIMSYTDWDGTYDDLLDESGYVLPEWRNHVPPFDPAASRAARDNGTLPEFIRTVRGASRSGNPGASVAAIGAAAHWLTSDHPLDYGYGEGSPFAKLVQIQGKVLMIGAPLDTMKLLHHAEHLARIPGKRLRCREDTVCLSDRRRLADDRGIRYVGPCSRRARRRLLRNDRSRLPGQWQRHRRLRGPGAIPAGRCRANLQLCKDMAGNTVRLLHNSLNRNRFKELCSSFKALQRPLRVRFDAGAVDATLFPQGALTAGRKTHPTPQA